MVMVDHQDVVEIEQESIVEYVEHLSEQSPYDPTSKWYYVKPEMFV